MDTTPQAGDHFRNGFSGGGDYQRDWLAEHKRQKTARFPGEPSPDRLHCRAQSQPLCVEIYDLASVSPIVRSFSNSARRTPVSVSANVRQEVPLIARRHIYYSKKSTTLSSRS